MAAAKHYPSFQHHYRFKIPLHCRILNRHWHTGSDASRLSVPALHPAVISLKKTKKVQQASSLSTATTAMLAGSPHRCSIKQFIQETTHTSQTKEEGFNTTQINSSTNRIDSYITQKGSTHHKLTHPQIDSYNIE